MAAPTFGALGRVTILSIFFGTGCSATDDGASDAEVHVFSASSLREAFRELESAFEAEHPAVDVVPVFAGSQVLRVQIEQGAHADVFASASPGHVEALVATGRAEPGRVFARNRLAVLVPEDNPAGIESFEDLPRSRRLVLGTEHVPVGQHARRLLERASRELGPHFAERVLDGLASEESNVRLVRAKVELGEADAAIVYVTDRAGARRTRALAIPDLFHVDVPYSIAIVRGARKRRWAERWTAFVLSPAGRRILRERGFLVPSS